MKMRHLVEKFREFFPRPKACLIRPVQCKTVGVKGSNPYFNLTPGYTLEYRHGNATDTFPRG